MSAPSKCLQCGKTFFRFTPDGNRALGSLTMIFADPDCFFCTLRCAARYGILAARAKKAAQP